MTPKTISQGEVAATNLIGSGDPLWLNTNLDMEIESYSMAQSTTDYSGVVYDHIALYLKKKPSKIQVQTKREGIFNTSTDQEVKSPYLPIFRTIIQL